jgi:hypothetical protein
MTPDRCPDCGVLSGSVHHALCGYERELSATGQLQPVKKKPRLRDIRRSQARAEKRAARQAAKATYRQIDRPFEYAMTIANHRFLWLRKLHREDFEQTVCLALLEARVNPFAPAYVDAHGLTLAVQRNLDRLQCEVGLRRIRENGESRYPRFVDTRNLMQYAQVKWATTWATA